VSLAKQLFWKYISLILAAIVISSCGADTNWNNPYDPKSGLTKVNTAPQAVILVNQTEVTAGSEIILDGSQSVDPEAGAITYRWYECDEYLSVNPEFTCNGNVQTGLLNIPSVGLQSDLGEYAEGPTQTVILPEDGEYTFVLVVNDGELDSDPRDVVINVTPAPSASRPFAMAFADPTSGVSGAKIILNGSKSEASTAGRTITEYQWYENAANPQLNLIKKVALLPYASGVTQAVWPVTPGTYRFTLIVIDSGGIYSSPNNNDEVQITVSALNSAPTASAGLNRVVKRGNLVTLNGSGSSDPENNTLTYSWTLSTRPSGSFAPLINSTSPQSSFTPDLSGDYVATLVANDGQLSSPPASVKIQCNFPPYPNAGDNQTVAIGELVTLDGSGSFDADLDPITYSWIMSPPAGSVASLSSLVVARPTFVPDREGNYIFRLALNDGLENSDYPAWVTVTAINHRPIAIAKASPNPASVAATIQLNGSSSYDPDGYPVTYAWSMRSRPAGSSAALISSNTVTPTFMADLVGNFLVKLVVNDGFIDSYADWITVTAVNIRPVAVALASPNLVSLAGTVQLNGSSSYDPDGSAVTWDWALRSRPTGSAATIIGPNTATPTFVADKAGNFLVKLVVNDGFIHSYADWITVTAVNTRPVAVALASPNPAFLAGTVQLNGSSSYDPDGSAVTWDWALRSRPSGSTAVINPTNTATPTFIADKIGDFLVKLVVNDGFIDSYADWITVTVPDTNLPPNAIAWPSTYNPSSIGDSVTLYGNMSTDPEGGALSYKWRRCGGSPDVNITNDTTSTATAGPFPNAVTYTFVLTVTDNGGLSNNDFLTVSVGPNHLPNAEAKVNGLNQANAGFYDRVTLDGSLSSDPDGDSITYYSWQQVSGIPVSLEITEWPKAVTFTAPDEISDLVFSLVVSDGKSLSYPDYVTVSVWRSVFTSAASGGDRFINEHVGQPAGLFVSQRGTNVEYCGDAVTTPCNTISYAIHNRWPVNITADVYVGTCGPTGNGACTGTFSENVVLYDATAKRGVSIFGGFFEDGTGNWWRDMDSYPTAVTITTATEVFQNGVVSCDTTSGTIFINNQTYIDGFEIKCNPAGVALHYAILCDSSTVAIRNNAVSGQNSNGTNNWAIYIYDSASGAGSPTIVNNYINGGTAGGGPPNETYGIYFYRSGIDSFVAHNLIFAGNPAAGNSYGIIVQSSVGLPSTPIIVNNIINGGGGSTGQYSIYENGTYADTKIYNNDMLLNGGAGAMCLYYDADGAVCRSTIGSVNSMINSGNNISVNPKFENADWADSLGKQLRKESQCIDAGTNAGIRSDWGGNKRPVDVRLPDGTDVDNNPLDPERNIFDIGPYEYPNAVSQP
jgi:hypothetical protein